MASTVANVKVGSCTVTFNSVDLGLSQGGIEVSYAPTYFDVTVDKYGKTVVEKRLVSEKVTVKVKLAEYQLSNLNVSIPYSTLSGTTSLRLDFGSVSGKGLAAKASVLKLHPYANATGDFSEDFTLGKAVVESAVVLPYKVDGERLIEVTFIALLDETLTDGKYLGYFGYQTAA